MRVRGLKVWFPLRRGLARELVGRASLWVRALDGVSFDINRGEVFCLVGESGCGKTTTGKALLRLVDVTEGDVFLEMPKEEFSAYESLQGEPPTSERRSELDGIRRKYSLTWTETIPWTWKQALLLIAFLSAGFAASVFLPAAMGGLFSRPLAQQGYILAAAVLSGILLGAVGSLPPSKPHKRTPVLLALLSLVSLNLIPVVSAALFPSSVPEAQGNPLGALAAAWGESTFALLVGVCLAPAVAGGVARAILGVRQDRAGLRGIKMRTLRRRLHLIFQDPYESLNPKQSVFEIVAEPLQVNRVATNPEEVAGLVSRSLEDAGLRPAEDFMFRFPHELSGGQRQRVSIAAALALEPHLIVAEEPLSMLDVSIRTEILQLMMDLRKKRGLTYLFITHDLSLAWILADRIAVMYLGQIVEQGSAEQVIAHPKHPYTQALISVVPSPDPRHKATRTILKGERPDPVDIPTGCRFHPRCPMAFEPCGWSPSEVLDALKELAGSGPMGGMLDAAQPDSALSFRLPLNSETLEAWIREKMATEAQTHRALKALRAITGPPDARRVVLHGWEPVSLFEVAPGNDVACLLLKPGQPEAPALAST
jgi:oligopeptide/dipeptide ABC transporter ATP-binding protein